MNKPKFKIHDMVVPLPIKIMDIFTSNLYPNDVFYLGDNDVAYSETNLYPRDMVAYPSEYKELVEENEHLEDELENAKKRIDRLEKTLDTLFPLSSMTQTSYGGDD